MLSRHEQCALRSVLLLSVLVVSLTDAGAVTSAATAAADCIALRHHPAIFIRCLQLQTNRPQPEHSSDVRVRSRRDSDEDVADDAEDRCKPDPTSRLQGLRALCPFRVQSRTYGDSEAERISIDVAECLCTSHSCGGPGSDLECTPLRAAITYRQSGRLTTDLVPVACVCAAPDEAAVTPASRARPLWETSPAATETAITQAPPQPGKPRNQQQRRHRLRHGRGGRQLLRNSWRF